MALDTVTLHSLVDQDPRQEAAQDLVGALLRERSICMPGATAESVLPTTDELGDPLTSFEAITNYNNYYEFSTDKQAVAEQQLNARLSAYADVLSSRPGAA